MGIVSLTSQVNRVNVVGSADDGGGFLGIIGNAFDDLKGMAAGLGNIGGAVIHDAAHALSLGTIGSDFVSDDIVKAIPGAITADYADRYGGGVSGILQGIYEHPLSFLGDALTVATAGGYAAAKSAATAAKAADGLGAAAKLAGAATVGDEVALASKGLLAADDISEAAKFVQRIQGVTTRMRNPITGRIEEIAPAFNPVKRLLYQKPYIKLISDTGGRAGKLADRYVQVAATLGDEGMGYANTAERIRGVVDNAVASGDYVVKPSIAKYNLRRFSDFAFGTTTASSRRTLGAADAAIQRAIEPLMKVGYTAEDAFDVVTSTNTLHVVDNYTPRAGAGPRDSEALLAPARDAVRPTQGTTVAWDPALSREQAIALATQDRLELTSALREGLGADFHVVAPDPKTIDSIKSSGVVVGGDLTDDISRFRVIHADMHKGTVVDETIRGIEESTGLKVRRVENTLYTPDAGGERYVRLVAESPDGHPIEFQLTNTRISRTLDAASPMVRMAKLAEAAAIRGRDAVQAATVAGDIKKATSLAEEVTRNVERARKLNLASQALWGGTTAEVRQLLGGHADSAARVAIHDLRLAVQEHFTSEALLNGTLDPLSMFDNVYLPLRYKNGARYSRTAGATIGGGESLELQKLTADAGLPQPVYVPLVSAIHGTENSAILAKVGGRGELAVDADRFLKRNTGELLSGKSRALKDLTRVYHMRALAAARAQQTFGLVNTIVAKTGRVIDHFDQAGVDEVVLSRTHMKNLFDTRRAIEDAGLEDLMDATGSGAQLKRALTESVVANQQAFKGLVDPDLVAVPSIVYERLQQSVRTYLGHNVDLVFRTPVDMWKSFVLAGSPRWVINNIVGNILFLKTQGGKLSDVVRQLSPEFRRAVDEAMGPGAKPLVEGGLFSETLSKGGKFTDENLASAAARRVQESKLGGQSFVMKGAKTWSRWVRTVNNGVEDAFRRASYITGAEKVAEELSIGRAARSFWTSKESLDTVFRVGTEERAFGRAVDEVNKYLNDYHKMTPFGRNVLRPYIAPFWSFYRHASKLLLTMPFEHPGRARLAQLVEDASEDQLEKLGELPPWLSQSALPLGATGAGDQRFLSTAGPNPFNVVMGSPGQLLAPPWKVLFEQTTGVNSFSGRAFTAPDVYDTPMGQFKVTTGADGQPIVEEVDKVTPGLLEHLLQQVPQYEMVKDLLAGGSTYDTATLIQAMKGQAAVLDNETGDVKYPKSTLDTLGKFFGYSTYSIDVEKYQEQQAAAVEAAITMWENRMAAREMP